MGAHQRRPRRLRRGQAQEGLENSSGRRYAGQSACQPLSTASPLEVVKLPEAKRGFVLLPRRWVVERSFGWAARFRRLAIVCLMLHYLPEAMNVIL